MKEITTTIRKGSSLLRYDLYQLEGCFGSSTGHGFGFGAEDIDWHFNGRGKNKGTYLVFSVIRRSNMLKMTVARYDNEKLEETFQSADFIFLSKKTLNALRHLLRYHCVAGSVSKLDKLLKG